MDDMREALKGGGILAVFLGSGYDIPSEFGWHAQLRGIAANMLTPQKVAGEFVNVKAAILTDQIDHRIYLAIHQELKRRKVLYVLRKSAGQLADTLRDVFHPAAPEKVTVAASQTPTVVPAPAVLPPVAEPPEKRRGAVKAFVEQWWGQVSDLTPSDAAKWLLSKATEVGLATTQGSLEQQVRVRRKKVVVESNGAGLSERLDDAIASLEALRDAIVEPEGRGSDLVSKAARADELQQRLDRITEALGVKP